MAADGLRAISGCKGIAEDAAKQVALLGILRLGLDGKLSMHLGYGTDGMNPVDGSGIGTVDGYEQGALERSGDGGVVNAGAERHTLRVQAEGGGHGGVIEMAVGTDVEPGRRLGERLRSLPRDSEPLFRREPSLDVEFSHLDGPSAPLVVQEQPDAAAACDRKALKSLSEALS